MNNESPDLMALIVVLILVVSVIAVAGVVITKRARFRCQFCNRVVSAFDDLDHQVKSEILAYFTEYENRIPDTAGIFVCKACRFVYDDFSGQKQSRDQDPYYGNKTFCKVCNGILYNCSPVRSIVKCDKCSTAYTWYTSPKYSLRFFMPDGKKPLQRRCINALDSF
jgi:hypothetical protein